MTQLQLGLTDQPIQSIPPAQSRTRSRRAKTDSHASLDSSRTRAIVLAAIESAGPSGLTRNEVAERTGLAVSSVCGRVFELLNSQDLYGQPVRIYVATHRRDKRSILVYRS